MKLRDNFNKYPSRELAINPSLSENFEIPIDIGADLSISEPHNWEKIL